MHTGMQRVEGPCQRPIVYKGSRDRLHFDGRRGFHGFGLYELRGLQNQLKGS